MLIAAIGLAIALVAIALILNSAITTENLQSRSADVHGAEEAIRYRYDARRGISNVLTYVNHHNQTTHRTLHSNLSQGIDAWGNASVRIYANSGSATEVSLHSTLNGTRITQDLSWRTYTNASGSTANWTLAGEVNQTRAFQLNVSDSVLEPSSGDEFMVVVENGTDSWRMNITESGNDIVVGVNTSRGDVGSCRVTADYAWINVTEGTIAGSACPPLEFTPHLTGNYTITYQNPENASGTYQLIIDNSTLASTPGQHFHDDSTGLSPFVSPAIYSVRLTIGFSTSKVHSNSTVLIAPDEPD